MSAAAKDKTPQPPHESVFMVFPNPAGVFVIPRAPTPEEFSKGALQISIAVEPARLRNQSRFAAVIYREAPVSQVKSVVSRVFAKKGDPSTRSAAYYEVFGLAVASCFVTP